MLFFYHSFQPINKFIAKFIFGINVNGILRVLPVVLYLGKPFMLYSKSTYFVLLYLLYLANVATLHFIKITLDSLHT